MKKAKKKITLLSGQQRQLADAALLLLNRQPWETFSCRDIFEVTLSDGQAVSCSISGKDGGIKGLAVYVGEPGQKSLQQLLSAQNVGLKFNPLSDIQDCLNLYFGNKEEFALLPDIAFSGQPAITDDRGNWLVFLEKQRHYHPAALTAEQNAVMLETLQKLTEMLDAAREQGLPRLPQNISHTLRSQSEAALYRCLPDGSGRIDVSVLPCGSYIDDEIGLVPESRKFALKQAARKQNGKIIELAVYYAGQETTDAKGRSYTERVVFMAESMEPQALSCKPLTPSQNGGQVMTDMLSDWISQHGVPSQIYVPDLRYIKRLKSLSSFLKLNVTVHELPIVMQMMAAYDMGIRDTDQMLPSLDDMDHMLDDLFQVLGLDRDEVADLAMKSKSEEEFQEMMTAHMQDRLQSRGLPDLNELLAGAFDDARDDLWDGCETRREKVNAVKRFFGQTPECPPELAAESDRAVYYDEPVQNWSQLLLLNTKEELKAMAKEIGLKLRAASPKSVFVAAIMEELQTRFREQGREAALKDLLGEEAGDLVTYVEEKLRRQQELIELYDNEDLYADDFPDDDEDQTDSFADFPFSMDAILTASRWGLLDIDGVWDYDELALLLMPAEGTD